MIELLNYYKMDQIFYNPCKMIKQQKLMYNYVLTKKINIYSIILSMLIINLIKKEIKTLERTVKENY